MTRDQHSQDIRRLSSDSFRDLPAATRELHGLVEGQAATGTGAHPTEMAGPRGGWRVAAMTACLTAGVLAGSLWTFAQTFQGGVRGIVQDPNGGLIASAELTLVNDETGVTRSTASNAAGEYSFANVQPGAYTLRADLDGFSSFVAAGLTIGISSFLVSDITLNVGGVEETITVTAETPLIENGTASVASTIDRKQIEVLPSPGRNVFILAVNTPNVVHTGNPVWVKQSDQTNSSLLSLGGGPLRGNNYTIDGVSMTDMRNRSVIIPVFEAVEEMKVQTNTYDAEMGRTGGGVFNTIHRRGTNDWAGSALYQFRPGATEHLLEKAGPTSHSRTSTVDCCASKTWKTLRTTCSEAPSAARSLPGGRFSGSRPKGIPTTQSATPPSPCQHPQRRRVTSHRAGTQSTIRPTSPRTVTGAPSRTAESRQFLGTPPARH